MLPLACQSVCVCVCMHVRVCVFADWSIFQWGCVQRCGWLAGSVGHFFETLHGEC